MKTFAIAAVAAVIFVTGYWCGSLGKSAAAGNSSVTHRYEFKTFSGLPMRVDKVTGTAEIVRPTVAP